MKNNGIRIIGLLSLLTMVGLTSGCLAVAAAGAAGGSVAYIRGDLEATFDEPLNDAYNASREAIENLDFKLIKESKDAVSARILARTAQDEKITINLNETAAGMTAISIRIGRFGDEVLSNRILREIEAEL